MSDETSNDDMRVAERGGGPLLVIAGASVLLAIVTAAVVGWLFLSRDGDPGDNSVDAGFARDMSTHHAQAVEMAGIVYRRTEDQAIRTLAYDILTTQQAQIGMMGGWLALWDLPSGGEELPMSWMGHGMSGPMIGMATDEEVASLETLPPAEMDRTFLQLMIGHHKGASTWRATRPSTPPNGWSAPSPVPWPKARPSKSTR
jgi:uncharacterized protein (DUF305 family)